MSNNIEFSKQLPGIKVNFNGQIELLKIKWHSFMRPSLLEYKSMSSMQLDTQEQKAQNVSQKTEEENMDLDSTRLLNW